MQKYYNKKQMILYRLENGKNIIITVYIIQIIIAYVLCYYFNGNIKKPATTRNYKTCLV